jgi:hypothetical protein
MKLLEMDEAATLEGVRPARASWQWTDTGTTGNRATHPPVRVPNGVEPRWWPAAVARFRELLTLDEGWDTYGSPPIDRNMVDQAVVCAWALGRNITAAPWIVPTSVGGVQLEWHGDERTIEITFNPRQQPNLYIEDEFGEDEHPCGTQSDVWARVVERL